MGTESDSRALHAALNRLRALLEWPDARLYGLAEPVSRWSPAQHVQHTLIALHRILDAVDRLRAGEDEAIRAKGHPTLQGRALLLGGWIPRGKAQAPDFARPDAIPSRAAMRESLEAACEHFAQVAPQASSLRSVPGVIEHPVLSGLSASQWWRFARVHTEHHLAIIDDADRQRSAAVPKDDATEPLGELT